MGLAALLIHLLAGFTLAFVSDLIGASAFRRSHGAHWTERARLLWPARTASTTNLIVVPLLLDVVHRLLAPHSHQYWLLNDTAAYLGAGMASYGLDHTLFPQLTFREWRQLSFAPLVSRYFSWMLPVIAGIAMPVEAGPAMLLISAGYLALHFALQRGLLFWIFRRTGHIVEPRPRLQRIVDEACARADMRLVPVSELRSAGAQAYALPLTGELMFTGPMVDICTDGELSAICHHELAHLTESKWILAARVIGSLSYVPFIFISPLMHAFHLAGLLMAILAFVVIRRSSTALSQRMEKRADAKAVDLETEKGDYAQALLGLYQNNLIPAVGPSRDQTHPHLYDRMVDAGITPDFARPLPPRKFTWIAWICSVLLGMLFVILLHTLGTY